MIDSHEGRTHSSTHRLLTLLDFAERTYSVGPSTGDDVRFEDGAWHEAGAPSGADIPPDGGDGENFELPAYGLSVASDVDLPPPAVSCSQATWGPSVGSDIDLDETNQTGFHAAWAPSVGSDIEFNEPEPPVNVGVGPKGLHAAWGPSVGEDLPQDADGPAF